MFHEQLNSDGSVDLLCLACRALVGGIYRRASSSQAARALAAGIQIQRTGREVLPREPMCKSDRRDMTQFCFDPAQRPWLELKL
jgi:hypothetical protein